MVSLEERNMLEFKKILNKDENKIHENNTLEKKI